MLVSILVVVVEPQLLMVVVPLFYHMPTLDTILNTSLYLLDGVILTSLTGELSIAIKYMLQFKYHYHLIIQTLISVRKNLPQKVQKTVIGTRKAIELALWFI